MFGRTTCTPWSGREYGEAARRRPQVPGQRHRGDPEHHPAAPRLREEGGRVRPGRRALAAELHVPLTDFHAEILRRRPTDWDGAADAFRAYEGLRGADAALPRRRPSQLSEAIPERLLGGGAAAGAGYGLRNWMVLLQVAEVMEALGRKSAASGG